MNWPFLLATIAASPVVIPNGVAIVALDESPEVVSTAAALEQHLARSGRAMITIPDARLRLTGTAVQEGPSDDEIDELLERSRHLEGYFDSEGAEVLRTRISNAFDDAERPSPALRRAAAEVAFDRIVLLLSSEKETDAAQLALQTLRKFPDIPLDPSRIRPDAMAMLAEKRRLLPGEAQFEVVVASDQPGELMVDGQSFGPTPGRVQLRLAPGSYRTWLSTTPVLRCRIDSNSAEIEPLQ